MDITSSGSKGTITLSLAYICNLSLLTSIFPSDWKQAKVTPIFKDGDKFDVGNYRPISVLSIIFKILERAVHDQLYSFLTTNSILHPHSLDSEVATLQIRYC